MEQQPAAITEEMPEHLRLAQQAFERAVKKAFLTGQAYDPDGNGYAYWKAREEAEQSVSRKK